MDQLSFREWILTENDSPKCPKCGANMVRRKGQYGEFWGCSRYSQGCRGTLSIATPKPELKPKSEPKPELKPKSEPKPVNSNLWIAAFAKIDVEGLKNGEKIAVRAKGSDWEFESLETDTKGMFSADKIRGSIESFKGADKQPMRGESPAALAKILNVTKKTKSPDEDGPQEDRHPREDGDLLYPAKKYKLLPEQKKIDEKFKNIIESGNQSHVMIDALAGSGKAQPLDSLLLTPNGYIRMGDVTVGTKVFGSDGLPHSVVGVFPQGQKEIYEIEFTDGSKTQCCGNHLWVTETKRNRDKSRFYKKPLFSYSSVVNTEEILETVIYKNRPNHYVPLVNPLVFDKQKVEIDPYVLGVLLGDGSFRTGHISYSTEDQEIINSINSNIPIQLTSKYTGCGCDYRIVGDVKGKRNPIIKSVKKYGLWGKKSDEKFVPNCYKLNDIPTRVAILQGLLDTDSYVQSNSCNIEYYTTSYQLSEDVKFLVESLGGTASICHKKTTFVYKDIKKEGKLCYRLNLKMPREIQPFRLSRKLNNYTPRTKYHPKRAIVSIKKIGIKECQCISVDSPDNLYITNNCILTHNTTVLKHLAWKYGNMGQKWLYLVFNKKNQVEAKAAFPDWVSVYTTNGFLNQMLKSRANKTSIPQTDYIASLAGDEDGNSGKIEKIREIIQGGKFTGLMSSWGLLDPDEASRHRSVPARNQKTIASLFKQIRFHFKEEVIRLTNLAKSFAIDHRKPEAATKVLDDIFDKYDIDSGLSDVKDRIKKYSPSFSDMVVDIMESITGYNFMEKDYKEEMINAVKWLLHETMPHVSDHMHNRGTRKYRLGSYRDFNDDLWFAATHADELVWDKFDVVLADEVQDFNEPQKIMLKKLHDAGAKIVAVGDKNQSLYRFRGADSDSFDNVAKSLEELSHDKNVKTQLTHNMRSRKKILDFANSVTHVNNLKQGKKFADGGEGEVTENEMKFDDAFTILQREMQQGGKITKSTAFLSRTNEPLAHTALKLLYLGIPFVIVGKDIAGDLTKHIRKIMGFTGLNERSPVEDLSAKLQDHINQEKDTHEGDNAKKSYLKELDEVTGALTAAISQFTGVSNDGGYSYNRSGKTVDDFSRWLHAKLGGLNIEEKEKDYASYKDKLEQNAVVLTTAHRSKGLEFHRVFILRYDQFPHPKAKRDEDLAQEANAKYVAITRGMDEVHILKLEGQPGYKGESSESE